MASIQDLHDQHIIQESKRGRWAGVGVLITALALAIIVPSAICCLLPSVNALSSIAIPVIIPCVVALIPAAICIIKAIRMKSFWKDLSQQTKQLLDQSNDIQALSLVDFESEEKQIVDKIKETTKKISDQILSNKNRDFYNRNFINRIKKLYPTEQHTDATKVICKILDKVAGEIDPSDDTDVVANETS